MNKRYKHTSLDFSTINTEYLATLPEYDLPPSYCLGEHGVACAFDPPGYPSYFAQFVYTRHGTQPRRGKASIVIMLRSYDPIRILCAPGDEMSEEYEKTLRRLWKPLPLNHERTRAWITNLYLHFRYCYGTGEPVVLPGEAGKKTRGKRIPLFIQCRTTGSGRFKTIPGSRMSGAGQRWRRWTGSTRR